MEFNNINRKAKPMLDLRIRTNFLKEAYSRYGGFFKYGTDYVSAKVPIEVQCRYHGTFTIKPRHHLTKENGGCPQCKGKDHKFDGRGFLANGKNNLLDTLYEDAYTLTSELDAIKLDFITLTVTPKLAERILVYCNNENRPINPAVVRKYAKSMKEGRWVVNTGEPLRFDTSNNAIDAQHRLLAIIESDVSIPFIFFFNVDTIAKNVIDTGKIRTAGDALGLNGLVKNAPTIASAIRAVIKFESVHTICEKSERYAPNEAIVEYYRKYPADYWVDLHDKCKKWMAGGETSWSGVLNPGNLMAIYHIIRKYDEKTDLDKLFNKLFLGIGLEEGSPEMYFREKLRKLRMREAYSKEHFIRPVFMHLLIDIYEDEKFRRGLLRKTLSTKMIEQYKSDIHYTFWFYRTKRGEK